jgi:hypothetical protein
MISIGDANDPATILFDADVFFSTYFKDNDADEVTGINLCFTGPIPPPPPARQAPVV